MTDRELVIELLRKVNQRILYDGALENKGTLASAPLTFQKKYFIIISEN